VFDRAYNDFRRLHHIKVVGFFFVVRAKNPLKYQHIRWKRRMPKNVLSDSIIRLTVYKSKHDYPEVLRRIEYYDDEQDRVFVFLTNALSLDALEVANLYKSRWKIELFFKWMKQHLNIQRFWGETENAVRIQIYAAITAYCMVAIIQHETKTELSIYEVLETVSMVLTDKTPLYGLLCNSNDNIDNELDESSGPTLF
jgi:IS4 transposase